MKKILIDTNIVLDIALQRREFADNARIFISTVFEYKTIPYITASSVTDIYYVLRKTTSHSEAKKFLINFTRYVKVAGVDKNTISNALNSEIKDFEDAIQVETANSNNIGVIVTRNKKDFVNSSLHVFNPEEYIELIKKT